MLFGWLSVSSLFMIIVMLVLVVLCDSIGVGSFVDGGGDCSATGRVLGGFLICNVSI